METRMDIKGKGMDIKGKGIDTGKWKTKISHWQKQAQPQLRNFWPKTLPLNDRDSIERIVKKSSKNFSSRRKSSNSIRKTCAFTVKKLGIGFWKELSCGWPPVVYWWAGSQDRVIRMAGFRLAIDDTITPRRTAKI